MFIIIDTREKKDAIQKILATFDRCGIKYSRDKLPVADYWTMDNPKVAVDRKQNLLEIATNVAQGHDRFVRELTKAKEMGIHLVILCEHGTQVRELTDVIRWENPRLKQSPLALTGERLYRIMTAISKKYGVEWQFCTKADTGYRIIEILSREVTDNAEENGQADT